MSNKRSSTSNDNSTNDDHRPPLPPDTVANLTPKGHRALNDLRDAFSAAARRPISFEELGIALRKVRSQVENPDAEHDADMIFELVVRHLRSGADAESK